MSRRLKSPRCVLLSLLVVLSGCHSTQPFYLHEDGDLSHYLDKATDLEYPDVCTASLPEVAFAQRPLTLSDPEPREIWDLTLEEAICIAVQNSKVIRNLGGVTEFGFADALVGRTANAATVYDAALVESDPQSGVESALAAFDAQLSIVGSQPGAASSLLNYMDRPQPSGSSLFPSVLSEHVGGLSATLEKRTAGGTRFAAASETEYNRGNRFGSAQVLPSYWTQSFEMRAVQPLLRGRGTQVNRVPILLARINTDISLATFEASVRNLVLDIENTYWDLHLAYRNLETARVSRDSAQRTWHSVETQTKATKSVRDEAQAREQYFFFRSSLEQALRQLYETETRLRFLMGLASADGRLIRPIDEPTLARVEFDWPAIHQEALVRSPELRQQKWFIKRRELELIAARNQLLPTLDVGAAYRWLGLGDELITADRRGINFPDEGSTAFDELTEGKYQEFSLFMEFQMPVGFRRELAGVRNAQLALARERARLEDIELNVSHLLSTAIRNLDFNYQNAQTHFNRWKAAAQEVDSVEELYKIGKEPLDQVLDAHRRRAQAQADYYRAIAEYNKSLTEVHFRKGSLLEYNHIRLAEGPWPEKAYWDALERARERDASYYLDYGSTRPRVISRGPVAQQQGAAVELIEGVAEPVMRQPREVVPSPTPAERQPQPKQPVEEKSEDRPRQPGPITNLPEGPALNAPHLRAASGRPAAARIADGSRPAFDWGNLGLPGGPQPVRQAVHAQ